MATVEIPIGCELIVMGPPDPAQLVLTITRPETGWQGILLIDVQITAPDEHEHYSLGTTRDSVSLFVSELERVHAAGEGAADLRDEEMSYIRIRANVKEDGTFGISGRFYSTLIDTDDSEPDPAEESFFEGMYAFAEGFRGLRVYGPQLAKAIADLEAALAALAR